ncbi:sensor histidine kinase [Geodermatophilus sp. CPCC 205506]|uniref:sensor histidine kinase n=1 Tax=Geodermatophilus sp. CPCC 205506 TaxID=2936596 RepID=UPI003EEFAF7A
MRTLAAAAAAAAAATVLGLALLVAADGLRASLGWGLVTPVVVALVLVGVGTPLARRPQGRPVGLLLLGAGTVMAATIGGGGYAVAGLRWGWPAADVVGRASDEWLWAFAVVPLTTVLLAVFPDGRAPTPRWRPVVWLGWTATVVVGAGSALRSDLLAVTVGGPLWILAGAAAVAGLVQRWRRSDGLARQQIKYLLLAALLVVLLYAVADLLPYHARQAAFLMVPLSLVGAVGLAVVRYRLYDVDLAIRRTTVFAGVTGLVFLTYLAVAAATGTTPSERAALVAAVVVAALAEPARRRLQRATTRLLFGRRDEPLEALAVLRDRLGDADGDAELAAVVTDVVPRLVRTRAVGLALLTDGEPREIGRVGPRGPDDVSFPLVHRSELLGTLTVGLRDPGVPFGRADAALLTELAHQVAAAVHAARLRRDLRAAAERASRAAGAERDRLRRELHDRLMPLLVGTGLTVDAMRRSAAGDGPAADGLGEVAGQLRSASAEVRQIVDRLQPARLLELGLQEAVRDHLDRLTQLKGTPSIRLTGDVADRLPDDVQEAAYVLVLEAVTNVVRHAGARHATVRMARDGAVLDIEVTDDGAGLAEPYVAGVGIGSMRRRALELGGSFTLGSRPGGGSRLHATFPLEDAPCATPPSRSGSSWPTTTRSSALGCADSSTRSTASRWWARLPTPRQPSPQSWS